MKKIIFSICLLFQMFIFAEDPAFVVSMPEVVHDKEESGNKSHSLIHINIEDRLAIDMIEGRFHIPADSFSILPRGFYGTVPYLNKTYRILPFLKGVNTKSYLKFFSTAGFEYYYSNKDGNFIPGFSGRKLKKD